LLYEAKKKVFWTRVRLPPGPPENILDAEPIRQGHIEMVRIFRQFSMFPNGPVMVSTGQRVTEWTAHQQRCKKKKIYKCKR
jgi:hypothetical protein